MTKRWTRLCAALLLAVFSVSPVPAELSDVSQGDDVKALQMKLYNMGIMESEPDGEFGTGTEAGLRAFQPYLGRRGRALPDHLSL